MFIRSFKPLREELDRLGLGTVEFAKLPDVVVLAGPNGAGKSRILEVLSKFARREASGERTARRAKINALQREIAKQEGMLQGKDRAIFAGGDPPSLADRKLRLKGALEVEERLACVATDPKESSYRVVNFVPKELNVEGVRNLPQKDLDARANQVMRVGRDGVAALAKGTFPYIERTYRNFEDATHPNIPGDEELRTKFVESFRRLNDLVTKLVGSCLSRSLESRHITLYGHPMDAAPLSDGQKVLLQLAVALHAIEESYESAVIVMDEPENHLHPAALIEVLDRVRAAYPAQIWIATHSVPLIAHLFSKDPTCLHFVDKGSVHFAGRKPHDVLTGLLGNDEERLKLLSFTALPDSLASSLFAAQCLLPAGVAGHAEADDQLSQIVALLNASAGADKSLKVLDCGAGKGRLIAELAPHLEARPVDYVAYDPVPTFRDVCRAEIEKAYGPASNRRFYEDQSALLVDHGPHAFDAVVLCNVLHEIEPQNWLDVLGPNGLAALALKETGLLLIVEDMQMPVGEKPNTSGFFLLDTLQLHQLFKYDVTNKPEAGIICAEARQRRLLAHAVPRKIVERCDPASITKAIDSLRQDMISKLRKLRSEHDSSFKAGALNGLWSQQLANCVLHLRHEACN